MGSAVSTAPVVRAFIAAKAKGTSRLMTRAMGRVHAIICAATAIRVIEK